MGEAKRRVVEITKLKAEAKKAETNWGEDRTSHPLIVIREPPPALVRMREALQLQCNTDIYQAAEKGANFEECLAIIATKLSIALDGYYDVPDLCGKLAIALENRTFNNFNKTLMHEQFSGLLNAAMIEREGSVELMEFNEAVKVLAAGTEAHTDTPYTVCNACITTFTCCQERRCCFGKPVAQLGRTVQHLKGAVH